MNQEIDRPQVAVIILNWNGRKLLKEFLPSVVRFTPRPLARVIVADNGSNDGSLELLVSDFPEVEVMRFPENYGFAGGYNKALAQVPEPYTVLLNSDVEVKDDWLTPLYDYMQSHPDVGACQPKIRAYRHPEKFEYAGAAGGYIDRNGFPYCRGRIFNEVETDRGQYDEPAEVFWATGAALMVRTEVYNALGGLDTQFFAHMEEIDLCWRMQLAGWKIAAVPQGVVYHLGGGSLDASNPRKTYLNFRNNLLMLYKNLPDSSRGRTLLKRRLLDTVAWAKFLATGHFGDAKAILKAHNDFRTMRRAYSSCPSDDLLHTSPSRPNILLQFFLRGRKTFSQLG